MTAKDFIVGCIVCMVAGLLDGLAGAIAFYLGPSKWLFNAGVTSIPVTFIVLGLLVTFMAIITNMISPNFWSTRPWAWVLYVIIGGLVGFICSKISPEGMDPVVLPGELSYWIAEAFGIGFCMGVLVWMFMIVFHDKDRE